MSLAINATTPSGIVLAADSRQSYRNRKGQARIGSDNAQKLFQLSRRIGVAVAGLAFLPENNVPKNIGNFIEEFRRGEDIEKLNVKEIAEKLHKFFEERYDYQTPLRQLPARIRQDLERQGCEIIGDFKEEKGLVKFRFKDPSGKEREGIAGVDRISIMTAGYNSNNTHEVYIANIPGQVSQKRASQEKGKEYGASWIGQGDVTSRIVLGWDGRIFNLPFVKKASADIGEENISKQLRGLEYQISWGTMTLQDAVDFCVLIIKTTEAIQRFSDGVAMDPGDIPGVGGEVDVAVITQDQGFIWVKKKNLRIDDKEIILG